MSGAYVRAIQDALTGFLNLIVRLALPISILLGLALIAIVVAYRQNKDSADDGLPLLKQGLTRLLGICLVGLTFLVCWSALKQTRPLAVQSLRWKDNAEAVANPTSDAPAVFQSGPVVATLRETTFTKNINLPPDIGQRLETEGVQALAQYLPDSHATEVLDQTDNLQKRGNLYFLTRSVKRKEELPMPFQKSDVTADFKQIGGRAYEVQFSGQYTFKNSSSEAGNVRFTFPMPQSGTVSGLVLSVGDQKIIQPSPSGSYEWSGMMSPGETRSAKVVYNVVGAKNWTYDIGSMRRAVNEFSLTVQTNGPVKFMRGSLQPTTGGASPAWKLTNVVTNQSVSLSFPTDAIARETFVQTLAMLPASLALFFFGTLLIGWQGKDRREPIQTVLGLVTFAFGLGAAVVLASYLGPFLGVIIALAGGCAASALVLGKRSLLASIPAALFGAAFLSAEHTGLIVAIVFLATAVLHIASIKNKATVVSATA